MGGFQLNFFLKIKSSLLLKSELHRNNLGHLPRNSINFRLEFIYIKESNVVSAGIALMQC